MTIPGILSMVWLGGLLCLTPCCQVNPSLSILPRKILRNILNDVRVQRKKESPMSLQLMTFIGVVVIIAMLIIRR